MREIKIRQYWQHEETGIIGFSEWTLNRLKHGIYGLDRHVLIAEVQFIGLKDKNGKESKKQPMKSTIYQAVTV